MGKVLFGIIAAVASLMLVESLTCNQCKYDVLGICIGSSSATCPANTSFCFIGKTTFPSISSAVGFSTQGCRASTGCNQTTSSTLPLLNVTYQTIINCCPTDNCKPTPINGAPSTKMTLTAAVGAAVLASMWGSIL